MKLDNFHCLSEAGVRPSLAHSEMQLILSYEHAVSVTYVLKTYFYSVQTFCVREILEMAFVNWLQVTSSCVCNRARISYIFSRLRFLSSSNKFTL